MTRPSFTNNSLIASLNRQIAKVEDMKNMQLKHEDIAMLSGIKLGLEIAKSIVRDGRFMRYNHEP
jgi:hypothetical protein